MQEIGIPCRAAHAEETSCQGRKRRERLPGLREVDALVIEVMEVAEKINNGFTPASAVGKYVENSPQSRRTFLVGMTRRHRNRPSTVAPTMAVLI